MTKIIKNPAASVRARLLVLSKQRGEQFNFTLERYALERLLFRLSQTSHSKSFLLKGGMLLTAPNKTKSLQFEALTAKRSAC